MKTETNTIPPRKPHWQKQHEWVISDVRFRLEEIWFSKKLLRKHPYDTIGEKLREIIKNNKKCLALEVKAYEKIYGDKPDVALLRRLVENR